MGTKLVKNIDDSIWRRFAGLCKMQNEKVGIKLTKVLADYMKKW